jgi:hypothetical protein
MLFFRHIRLLFVGNRKIRIIFAEIFLIKLVMRKLFNLLNITLLMLSLPAMLSAQTIEVHLPACPGLPYTFCLKQGVKQDTLVRDHLDEHGKASFSLPGAYASFRGVGNFSVKECGKNVNVIINHEAKLFINEQPGSDDAIVNGSKENDFINRTMAGQRQIIEQYTQANTETYLPQIPLRPDSERDRTALENRYAAVWTEIGNSPLHAARIVEILNCLTGMGSSLKISQETVRNEQRHFLVEKMNFGDLYTSGFWQMAFDLWFDIAQVSDTFLLDDSRKMIDRAGSDIPIRREVTQSIIRIFSRYAKDYLLPTLGTEYLTMPLNGQKAPEIKTDYGASFLPKNALVIFYETGCGMCHNELEALKRKYSLLTANQVSVISIAADTDGGIYEDTAGKFPWPDRFCDFKGFEGDNFRNYGIVGTPTLILTDKEGIVRGRYAQLKEFLKD